MSFARTKIQPPRPRAGWVARPLLEARLGAALAAQRLVLVSAPAGFGKTAALARQIDLLPAATARAWVAADDGDDLHRLLECLVAALEPYDLPWRLAPEALVAQAADAAPATRRRAAVDLLNALDASGVAHGVVVFDDLHRVEDPGVHAFLDLLLERLSPRWCFVVSSRHDPPLALARLRALGELAEFRQADLQFGRDEVHTLAASAGLDAAAADRLLQRTHGWAAGLRLALSAAATAGGLRDAGSDRAMFDFLATEVLDRIDPALRRFLLHTAVLPELTAARCAAVAGEPAAAALIERIERLGLFVTTLEAPEPTIKLHDLFRDALEHRLQREQPDALPRLLRLAAGTEADPPRRMALLLRAGDLDAAARTLLDHAPVLLTAGAPGSVAHAITQFPAAFAASSPVLQQVLVLLAWARWDFDTMAASAQRAEAGFAAGGQVERVQLAQAYRSLALNGLGRTSESGRRLQVLRREALGTETRVIVLVGCLWHALDLGSTHRVGPLLDELMDQLETTDDASLWYRGHPIPRTNGLPGARQALQRYVRGALRLAGDRPLPLRALAYTQQGFDAAWYGQYEAAEQALALACDDARWIGNPPNVAGTTLLLEAILHTLQGRRDAALASAQRIVAEHPSGRGRWSMAGNLFYAARIAAAFDDAAQLHDELRQLHALARHADVPPSMLDWLQPLDGHAAWLDGRVEDAIEAWQRGLAVERRIDRLGFPIEVRLRLADALASRGRLDDSAAVLAPVAAAVDGHAGSGGLRFALSALRRLAALDWGGRLEAAACASLCAWAGSCGVDCTPVQPALPLVPAAPGELSPREFEVLERIAAGDSNKLIARAFELSPHTVKRHVANILDKLGLDSRGQAAAWFHVHAARG